MVNVEVQDGVETLNPWQLKPWRLVMEKMEMLVLQPPVELEVSSADIAQSLAHLVCQHPGQRLCAENVLGAGIM